MERALIELAQAQARLLTLAAPLPGEEARLLEAVGRWLAAPLVARHSAPPFDASAMDGYAVRAAEAPGPWHVAAEVAAGAPPTLALGPGEAARIFTGAPVPAGADAVVIQEEALREGDRVRFEGLTVRPGDNVRRRGLDFGEGATLADAGARVTPALAALAAAAGAERLAVRRRPRVALLATGDELVPPGCTLGPGQIVNSAGTLLASLLAPLADLDDLGIVPDRADALGQALERGACADVLVSVGGASVGEHDLVRPALAAAGADISFWRVAIRPGKPMLAGRLGSTLVLGLPGNPVSAYVTALLFLLPALRAMAGDPDPLPRAISARAAAPLGPNGPRRDHMRARAELREGEWWATPAPVQDSSMLSTLAWANALLVREPGAPAAEPGTRVALLLLDNVNGAA